MIFKKLSCLSSIYLVCIPLGMAGEYIPPPSGPYQTSVVIGNDSSQSDRSGQVYKFPSDSLIQINQPDKPLYRSEMNAFDSNRDRLAAPARKIPPELPAEVAVQVNPQMPEQPQTPLPYMNYNQNPWAPDSVSSPDMSSQWNWNNQQYSYPQQNQYGQNQYGYPGQNNFMNNPLNSMPSPWTAMPMQPFFSGR